MEATVHFLLKHGYAVLFLAVLMEQIGLPFPAVPVLLAAGALAGLGSMNFALALGLSVAAAMAGDGFWFALGRKRGRSILGLLCRIALDPDSCVQRTENIFTTHRVKSLLFAKFVPGVSTMTPPLAAIFGVGLWRFLLYDAAGSALWAGSYLLAGLLFRSQLERLAVYAMHMGTTAVILVTGLAAFYFGLKYRERRKLYQELRMARITPDELKILLESPDPPIIVDLRHSYEWEDGKIPGALLVEESDLERSLADVPSDREVVLYCS
jgi:membrane protein DedA with SNARE-associated domain